MQVVQTLLQQKTNRGVNQKVAWLPVDPRVKAGRVVVLKDEPESGPWTVMQQFETVDSENIQRGWGLDLPKSQRTER